MSDAFEAAVSVAREAGVAYRTDAESRARVERDFGGIARGRSLLVAEPSTTEEASRLLYGLRMRGLGCTLRGAGYGQSGQSVAFDTVTLSTSRMDKIASIDFDARTVRVGAGATMRRVLEALRGSGLTPPVVPLNLDMSVGGLISAGGVGPTSHRSGLVADNVAEAEIVTGDGEVHRTRGERMPELFESVVGGLGRCGLVTRVVLDLAIAPDSVRVLSFFYDDLHAFLEDQRAITRLASMVHVEGFCWATTRGARPSPSGPIPFTHWTYGLSLAFDERISTRAEIEALLDSLHALRKVDDHVVDLPTYHRRYDSRFASMVETGAWTESHPWFEGMIPFDRVEEVLPRMLAMLPSEVGDGHRIMLLDTRRSPRFFGRPEGTLSALFGVFPVAFARSAERDVLERLDRLNALLLEVGGRRYLSGWLGADSAGYLRAHHGERFAEWKAARRKFDSSGTLRSALFPRGHDG